MSSYISEFTQASAFILFKSGIVQLKGNTSSKPFLKCSLLLCLHNVHITVFCEMRLSLCELLLTVYDNI